jgi:nucleoside-diphosphate-sugar epimerase
MSSILVIGGHGKVARILSPLLAGNGHTVDSVIRKESQVAEIESEGVKALVTDIEQLNLNGFREIVKGHDAVIWSAGAGGGSPERTYRVDRDAAILSMQAALHEGVKRFIMVSWSGSSLAHEVPVDNDFYHYSQAKAIADAVLRDTDLDWTILGPSTLTEDPGTGSVEPADGNGTHVSRENVARVAAAVVEDDSTIHKTLRFNDGNTPIKEFVRQS